MMSHIDSRAGILYFHREGELCPDCDRARLREEGRGLARAIARVAGSRGGWEPGRARA